MYSFYIDNKKANFKLVPIQKTTTLKQAFLQAFPLMNKIIHPQKSLV